jgi:hypothetical protein
MADVVFHDAGFFRPDPDRTAAVLKQMNTELSRQVAVAAAMVSETDQRIANMSACLVALQEKNDLLQIDLEHYFRENEGLKDTQHMYDHLFREFEALKAAKDVLEASFAKVLFCFFPSLCTFSDHFSLLGEGDARQDARGCRAQSQGQGQGEGGARGRSREGSLSILSFLLYFLPFCLF